METIRDRYLKVNEIIREKCIKSSRNADEVKLIVVTKKQPVEKIIQVIEAGAETLGENYPEEIVTKRLQLPSDLNPRWHMIGHIQSRKIKYIVQYFDFVHAIDRISVAQKLSQTCAAFNVIMPVLLEVNLSGEDSKQGYPVVNQEDRDRLIYEIETMKSLNTLELRGLMTMPPLVNDKLKNRKIFNNCRILLEDIQHNCALPQFNQLSMGTSQDYETAIEEGATYIRIGEAIIGTRQYL